MSVLMGIETLGEAWQHGWTLTARCAVGRRDGMKSIRECTFSYKLDMQTLILTRGSAFPLSNLDSRLRCPRCGSRKMRVLYEVPRNPVAAKAS